MKYPASFARSSCCSVDKIDIRGRWKRHSKSMLDRYINVEQKWIYGKVASALCPGGPCKYLLVKGSVITQE